MISAAISQWASQVRRVFGGNDESQALASPRVLVADDDDSVRTLCAATLGRAGYQVDVATNGREALDRMNTEDYDAVLMDLNMPYVHGATVLAMIGRSKPELLRRMAVITGSPDAAVTQVYGMVGAVLRKPLTIDSLTSVVRHCCDYEESAHPDDGSDGSTVRVR